MVARIGPKNRNRMRVFLREWREHLGYTQERIAERIGTTKGTVSRMEVSTREPNLGYLAAFAEAIDRDVAELFHDPARPTPADLLRGTDAAELEAAVIFLRSLKKTGTNN